MPPTLGKGRIGYMKDASGWKVRRRGDGSTAFDDTVGEVSGTWKLGRLPAKTPDWTVPGTVIVRRLGVPHCVRMDGVA